MSMLLLAIQMYSYVILASIVLSWLKLPEGNPLVEIVAQLTEPLLAPLRRVLPPMGGWDLSPLVLLIGLRVLEGVVS